MPPRRESAGTTDFGLEGQLVHAAPAPAVKLKIDHLGGGGWRQYFWVIFCKETFTFNPETNQQAIQQGEKSIKLFLFPF